MKDRRARTGSPRRGKSARPWEAGKGRGKSARPWDAASGGGKPAPERKPGRSGGKPLPPPEAGIRINRYLSMCGITSRRKAEELVLGGKVRVNGEVVQDLGRRVAPGRDAVEVDGKRARPSGSMLYLVLNKPKDSITTLSDERGRTTVMSMIRAHERVYPVGRLDRNTTGVLLLTNDGTFAHRLMHPKFGVPKSYRVTCDRTVRREDIVRLRGGMVLEDGTTAPAEVEILPPGRGKEVGITIHEGRNRQVRRMFEALGYGVLRLDRVAYGPVTKEGLARGGTRSLTRAEVRALKKLAGYSDEELLAPQQV